MQKPRILVFAGPNGSGKSTITGQYPLVGQYVNADEIEKVLKCDPLLAAKIATATREFFLANGMDFTMESVMSTTRNIELLRLAVEKGYIVMCVYVLTKDPQINVQRVNKRVLNGAHAVSPRQGETMEDAVKRRYYSAMRLIPDLCKVCSRILIFDNTMEKGIGEPALIAEINNGNVTIQPSTVWSEEEIQLLLAGKHLLDEDG